MSGPNAPLCRAFELCGWRTIPIDYLIDRNQDIADTTFQKELHANLKEATFVAAALDCSCKSRVREIPRALPRAFPMGLPGLKGHDKERVDRDNDAAEFFLGERQLLQ